MLGYSPVVERWPSSSGVMTVLKERELSGGPRVAADGGNDVVAYQTMHLFSGIDDDVKGSLEFKRYLPSAALFSQAQHPTSLVAQHPSDYEFWSVSE
jgi:hypothetical protein